MKQESGAYLRTPPSGGGGPRGQKLGPTFSNGRFGYIGNGLIWRTPHTVSIMVLGFFVVGRTSQFCFYSESAHRETYT